MSQKCTKISSCVCFFFFSFGLYYFGFQMVSFGNDLVTSPPENYYGRITLTASPKPESKIQCDLEELPFWPALKKPSLESFIRASSTEEYQELRLSGLAVYSNLANACQPLVDVSKSNIHVNKIAVITIASERVCALSEVAVNAQKAGYSVVIYFLIDFELQSSASGTQTDTRDKLIIPALNDTNGCDVLYKNKPSNHTYPYPDSFYLDIDRSYVEISVDVPQNVDDLIRMQSYLENLQYWFLLGPLITLEWLRRTKKFCCMSGGQQVNEERGTEDEEAVGETTLQTVVNHEESDNQEVEQERIGGEEELLIVVMNDPHSNLTTTEHTRPRIIRCVTALFGKLFGKFAVVCGYVVLTTAALPVGISSGGWSFFRFDQNENTQLKPFWAYLLNFSRPHIPSTYIQPIFIFYSFLPVWWSAFQIFCFFLYSRFACKTTWTVPTNFSKLIRSDWFASNVYLFVLGVVVPYCSTNFNFNSYSIAYFNDNSSKFAYFVIYNTLCTICNLLFIIILNKHKFVTRYVFYVSVCMIFAYVESDIVAVFYFMLNSEGSLNNLKLTALRTVAISYTLTLSLSTSMHIVRKLTKPQESLFEGLGEK